MNIVQKSIIFLLKSAITGEKYELPTEFRLEDVSDLIKKHDISPLIYIGALRCGICKSDPLMKRMFQEYGKNLIFSERQMYDVERIYKIFEENGIDYLPVKGCNMKALYPNPEMRVMGDADILIKMEQYSLVKSAMEELGFHFVSESDHDFVWKSPNLYVEIHYLLMYLYNEEYEEYFGNGWKLATRHKGHRYFMSCEDEFIYSFIHYTKHYRIEGIGCRHIVDLWVFLRNHSNMDFDYIENIVTKLSVKKFYKNTMRLIKVWFGDEDPDNITELMTNFIFDSGSWGTPENGSMARGVKAFQEEGGSSKGKAKVIVQAMFPPLEDLKHRYGILKKNVYLLPVIWVWRWFDAILFRKNNVKRRIEQVCTVCIEDVSQYEKNLTAVGLDFTFQEWTITEKSKSVKRFIPKK